MSKRKLTHEELEDVAGGTDHQQVFQPDLPDGVQRVIKTRTEPQPEPDPIGPIGGSSGVSQEEGSTGLGDSGSDSFNKG